MHAQFEGRRRKFIRKKTFTGRDDVFFPKNHVSLSHCFMSKKGGDSPRGSLVDRFCSCSWAAGKNRASASKFGKTKAIPTAGMAF
jgi:hypothetical protein